MSRCKTCGKTIDIAGVGRTPEYCSNACRQAAYRKRRELPQALTSRDRWVRHIAKRPVTADGQPASSTNPRTWTDYRTARSSRVGDGMGFVLGDGIGCIDIDHCIDDAGAINDTARRILAQYPTAFVEISPSGTGLHVWGTAAPQQGRRHDGYEIYSIGRYMTVTGRVYRAGGLPDISGSF